MSELLAHPGAVEADAPDDGVAAHYGALAQEQRRLEAGDGFVDLSNRAVVAIAGPDRLTWLHALTSQDFESLQPGHLTEALILSPQGHLEFAFTAIDDGETVLIHTEPRAGAGLVEFLERMKFMSRVEVVERPDLAVLGLPGLATAVITRSELSAVPSQRGEPSGLWAWEALRIAAGIPRIGRDTDHRTIPNEVGLLGRAVHLDKGCYRGQETVARVHNLGRPPRRLVLLHLDGSADRLPAEGSPVSLAGAEDGASVGLVGTSARHHELGPLALALVKRNADAAADLVVDGIAAAQEPIIDPDIGLHVRPSLGRKP
ncbi:MAG TPA: folate-binding protein [Aeromicrobium sp.]|nr:folate-binding protein [Aeromicrobium sp.]